MPKKHKAAKDPVQVERKTIATGASSGLVGILVAIAYAVEGDPTTIGWLPVWAQTLILAVLVALVPTYAAYRAPHTTRSDIAKVDASTAGTATIKVVADTSQFTAAMDEARGQVSQLQNDVVVTGPTRGALPDPDEGLEQAHCPEGKRSK